MRIGVPTEIKPAERRVALTPSGAPEIPRRGHDGVVRPGVDAALAADPFLARGENVAHGEIVYEVVARDVAVAVAA